MSIYNICNKLINKFNLYWQYPVISEKTVFIQQKDNKHYIGLPWATIIDKNINISTLLLRLRLLLDKDVEYITFCQHISFRKIIDMCKYLGIKTLYSSHKIIGEDVISGIKIVATPLYAVNIEDNTRNTIFKEIQLYDISNNISKCKLLTSKKDLLYSFIGGYNKNWYLTDIRKRIYSLKHPKNALVKPTGEWHFEKLVYHKQVRNINISEKDTNKHNNNTRMYNLVLLKSRYSLCPSGSGPNSIRLWESLAVGSIPIILADTLELPEHKLWSKAVIRLKENNINNLSNILKEIDEKEEFEMRKNCLILYEHFSNNFLNM